MIERSTLVSMWPTPLHIRDMSVLPEWQSFNYRLLQEVEAEEKRDTNPLLFGTVEATKTCLNIMQWQSDEISWFKSQIKESLNEISHSVGSDCAEAVGLRAEIEGWAVTYRRAASHRLHTHHGSGWSGVYYLQCGGVSGSAGSLELMDPRPSAISRHSSPGPVFIVPKPGRLVIFPSWLPHAVRSTLADTQHTRVCIAFNIGYKEIE